MKRSVSSIMIERILFALPTKKRLTKKQTFEKIIQELISNGEVPYKLDYKKFSVDVKKEVIHGIEYYRLNSKTHENENKIIYFHGGAYLDQPTSHHWKFLNKIAKDTRTEIWVPVYPKIPFYTAEYGYRALMKFYEDFSASVKDGEIMLMGDSAGGGLVLSMAQQIRETQMKRPIELIMISPWLDVSLTSKDIKEIEPKDAMLGSYGLRRCGELWAGARGVKDSMVSPLFGDLNGLGKMTVFTGTSDILNVDSRNLFKKAKEEQISINFFEKEHMAHVYPLLPIKESKEAIQIIENIITGI